MRRVVVGLVAAALGLGACTSTPSRSTAPGAGARLADPGRCVPVDVAVSSEKVALLGDLAAQFDGSDQAKLPGGGCAFVRVQGVASGKAATLLPDGWPDPAANGPRPIVWSPAASSWAAIVNQRLAARGKPPMAPKSEPFILTPLVIAMPKPMADALGYPKTPIGWADVLKLAQDPRGWGAYGHPEWGPFRLGKTNPNLSTSALNATIAEFYAATGKTTGLTPEDLSSPQAQQLAKGVESSVVHYGDITMTFLNNWFRNDARGTSLTYVSAVAVEEKSVIDYDKGNPDGILSPGEVPRPPRVPLVAIYPKEGTLYSDSPFVVLDAPWSSAKAKEGARRFEAYVKRPDAQRRVLAAGFRPGNPDVPLGDPISAAYGVDPSQPQTLLDVPKPDVLVQLLSTWSQDRKRARVELLLDVSGSMGDVADPKTGATKLDLAKKAVVDALDQFAPDDQVGLRIFATDMTGGTSPDWLDLVPIGPLAGNREQIVRKVDDLAPQTGTPLYTATRDAYDAVEQSFDPARINAVVLLTDGKNEDPSNSNLQGLISTLRAQSEGETARPVRVFAIAYGRDADIATLRQIAEATNAQVYDASDPTTISSVFTNVVSNF